jgi:hypothetical protein
LTYDFSGLQPRYHPRQREQQSSVARTHTIADEQYEVQNAE